MNVDLLSALEARAAEEPTRESVASENEFPSVLRASMEREDAAEARSQQAPSQDEPAAGEAGPREEPPSERRPDLERAVAMPEPTELEPDEESASEAAWLAAETEAAESQERSSSEAASLGGALSSVGVVADRVRASTDASAVAPVEGRPSELAAETPSQAKPGPSAADQPNPADARGVPSPPLADSEADLARQTVEAARRQAEPASRAPAAEPSSSVVASETVAAGAAEPAVARVAESPLRREALAPVERTSSEGAILEGREAAQVAATDASEQSQDPGSEQRSAFFEREDPGDARQSAEQVEFDRAQAGAQSAGVDPNLRQALATREDARNAPDAIAVSGGAVVANPIAGSVSEMTPAAPTGSSPAAASEAISVQTEWLATRGGGTARLVLHPQELGEVAIRVTLRGSSVEVVMVAHEAAAQSIAEDQADRLFQALASRDLRMDQFEVRRGEPGDLSQPGTDRFAESGGGRDRSGDGRRPGGEEASGGDRGTMRGLAGRASGGTEIPPRIVSVREPATGVDLRI